MRAVVTQGGEARIALLRLCVMTVTLEPMFIFLAQEYRLCPTHASALALYDAFCAPGAPARIAASGALPPQDLHLSSSIQTIRRQWSQMQSVDPPADGHGIPMTTPRRHLFDDVARVCREDTSGGYARIAAGYNPELTPTQNLPGGRMTDGQRQFVEYVWKPKVRPGLIKAAFWKIEDIE